MMPSDERLWPAERAAAAVGLAPTAEPRGLPFAVLLRASRVRAGLTQPQAGEILGVAWNTVARWERGEFAPPTEAELPVTQERALALLSPAALRRHDAERAAEAARYRPCQTKSNFPPDCRRPGRLPDTSLCLIGRYKARPRAASAT
jgi:hypothetical protein